MRRRIDVALTLTLATLSGCYTIRYERRGALPEPGAPRESWQHGVLGGTFQASTPVDLAKVCPAGVSSVENRITFANFLGQVLTAGLPAPLLVLAHAPLWEPTTVTVACARSEGGARSGKPTKVVVLPLAPLGGVAADTAQLLGDALAGELRKRQGVSVLTQSDVSALLGVERTRQMLGCSESGCMAEIGGALGADRVVHGSLGKVGVSLVVNLSALDPKRARTAASVSERLRSGGEEAFLDVLPSLADALLSEGAPPR